MGIFLYALFVIIISVIITHLITKPPKNKWIESLYCPDCDISYRQDGMNPSVYHCPECGEKTWYSMTKYTNKGTFVKPKTGHNNWELDENT